MEKPFLQQAEKDKQDYEELRKMYESDAAAKARGEDVPDRPELHDIEYHAPKPVISGLDQPSAVMASGKLEPDIPKEEEDSFAAFTHDDDADDEADAKPKDGSLAIDDFSGFHDPLSIDGMDLGGFEVVANENSNGDQQQWDEIQQLMGDGSKSAPKLETDTEDVSVAPALSEAKAATAAEIDTAGPPVKSEAEVDEIARQAEGDLVVPPAAEDAQPTESVNELPTASLPDGLDEAPSDSAPEVDMAGSVPEPSSAVLSEPLTEQITTPAPAFSDQALQDAPKDSFDAAALTGSTLPEVVADNFTPDEEDEEPLDGDDYNPDYEVQETVEPAREAMLDSGGEETVGRTEPGAMDAV